MFLLIINVLLYLGLLLYQWRRKKRLDCGVVITAHWSLVAIMAIPFYLSEINYWQGHLSLWPFIYLFITFIIYVRYFINDKDIGKSMKDIVKYRSSAFDIMCYLYLAAVLLNAYNDDISLSMISTSNLMKNGADLYADHFEREVVYKGFLDHLSHSYEYYAYVIVLIYSFNSLCQGRNKFALIMMGFVFVNAALKSSLTGTRGSLVAVITLYLGLYSLYYNFFTKKINRQFLIFAAVFGALGGTYLFALTFSRFDQTQMGSGGSVVSYLGQSMLYFDYGIADSDHGYYYGIRTFKNLAKNFGIPVPEMLDSDVLLGTHFGTAFVTNIGMLTLDFGLLGTMLFGMLLPWLLRKLYLYKGKLTIPGLYFYIFFYNRMINGAFVNGSGSDYLYWQAFMFFVILWMIVRFASESKKSTAVKVTG